MKRHIEKIKRHKFKVLIGAAILIVAINVATREKSVGQEAEVLKTVEVLAIEDITSDGGEIPVVGELQSVDQIDLRPQIGGQVSKVHVSVGDQVEAGQLLVELAHRDLDASVAQASAGLQSALAALEKMRNGARPEDEIIAQQALQVAKQQLEDLKNGGRPQEVIIAQTNLDSALKSLDDANTNYVRTEDQNALTKSTSIENAFLAVQSAQISVDKILNEDLDDLYDQNNGDNIVVAITEGGLETQANDARDRVGVNLQVWQNATSSFNAFSDKSAVEAHLSKAEAYLREMQSFLNVTAEALKESLGTGTFTSADIAAAKTTVNVGKTTIKAQLDAVISHRQQLNNLDISLQQALDAAQTQIDKAAAGVDTAKEQLNIVLEGGTAEQIAIQEAAVKQAEQQLLIAQNGARPEDIRLQQASVAQARASLALASAQRDKALLRAPIAGTVTYLPVELSDFVGSSSIAVSIANKDVLEVETYISETERNFIDVGNSALVNDEIEATVREIAPALDPINKKIRVMITIVTENPELTLGETVRVRIQKVDPEQSVLLVPLSAVKLKSTGAEMFVVNSENKLEKVAVEVGEVSGKMIEVITSFPEDASIVKDARGLRNGEEVQVK